MELTKEQILADCEKRIRAVMREKNGLEIALAQAESVLVTCESARENARYCIDELADEFERVLPIVEMTSGQFDLVCAARKLTNG